MFDTKIIQHSWDALILLNKKICIKYLILGWSVRWIGWNKLTSYSVYTSLPSPPAPQALHHTQVMLFSKSTWIIFEYVDPIHLILHNTNEQIQGYFTIASAKTNALCSIQLSFFQNQINLWLALLRMMTLNLHLISSDFVCKLKYIVSAMLSSKKQYFVSWK